jgi:hypothetical protein
MSPLSKDMIPGVGNSFLGVPIVAGAVRTPYRRGGPESAMVMKAVQLSASFKARPADPAEWMGN